MNFKHRLPSNGHGIDFIVYRPAGGAGFCAGRRLRLGGKHRFKISGAARAARCVPEKTQTLTGRLGLCRFMDGPLSNGIGGKKSPAGCNEFDVPLAWLGATSGNQKKDNTKLFSISQVVEPQRWLLCTILCQSGWPKRFAASLVSSSSH